jgi:hypothetical protein
MRLHITKNFIRKITVGVDAYLILQNKEYASLTIIEKKTSLPIYTYIGDTEELIYDTRDESLIKHIFDVAHIERYIL